MTTFRALVRKECAVLFASPVAYVVLTTVTVLTSILFFEHLRLYNQQLFLYASSNMGGFDSSSIPDYINLRDTVFFPIMEQLGLTLLLPIPLITMRVFAGERARGTDELLLTSGASLGQIVGAKCLVTYGFVVLMLAVSFIYPASAIGQGGIGLGHLLSVFIGLCLLGVGIASIGLVCSALTHSQVLAAAATVGTAYLFYDFGWAYGLVGPGVAGVLDAAALHGHFARFSEGLVALRDAVYFAALALAAFGLVRAALEWRRLTG
jgi:ABC-2 type transport system permease protein